MKIITMCKSLVLVTALLASANAMAYSPEELDKSCKKPHITDFNLVEFKAPENLEVPAEAEFIIKFSPWADPSTIKLLAKKEALPFTIESNSSFHKIKAKLPASLNGSFARINVSVKALLGCESKDGWLVKVANPN